MSVKERSMICKRCNGDHRSIDCPYYKTANKRESETYCSECRCLPYKTLVSNKLDALCRKNTFIVDNWSRKYCKSFIGNNDVNGIIMKFINMTEYDAFLDFKEQKILRQHTCNEITLELRNDGTYSWKEIRWDERSSTNEFFKY